MTSSSTLSDADDLLESVAIDDDEPDDARTEESDDAAFEPPPEQAVSTPATRTASSPVLRIGERFAAAPNESLHVSAFHSAASARS